MLFAFPPRHRRPRLCVSSHKARDCVAGGYQNISSALALGNLGIEGATDLPHENLIAAITLNPPAVCTVVHGAVLGCVQGGYIGLRLFHSMTSSAQQHYRWGYGKTERHGGLAVHDHLE